MMSTIEERIAAIETRLNARALPATRGNTTNAVGAVLRARRRAINLSMKKVMDNGGPCLAFQSDIETGKRNSPSLQTFIRWCAAIGCDPVECFADIVDALADKPKEETP